MKKILVVFLSLFVLINLTGCSFKNLFVKENEKEDLMKGKVNIEIDVKTGNPVTDIIISDFKKRTIDENIYFESAYHYPDSLKIDAFDMSIILNNALNNACEAVRKGRDLVREKGKQPEIVLRSKQRSSIFILEIFNDYYDEIIIDKEQEIPITSKESENHGFGIRNIREVAKRYYGDIDIKLEQKADRRIFKLTVMLQV